MNKKSKKCVKQIELSQVVQNSRNKGRVIHSLVSMIKDKKIAMKFVYVIKPMSILICAYAFCSDWESKPLKFEVLIL